MGMAAAVLLLSAVGLGLARWGPTKRGTPRIVEAQPVRAGSHPGSAPGAIQGVGELRVTVYEPGRVLCVPSTHACSERSYVLEVYYPAAQPTAGALLGAAPAYAGAPYPLIVFASGFDEDPGAYLPLITDWVHAGFVVAAPRFPLSSAWALRTYGVNLSNTALADAFESDMLNEPGDLVAAIDEVGQLSRSGPLAGRVDAGNVVLAGQSDGGDVVLAAADNTCCVIPGVRAVAVLSGAVFAPFGGSFFTQRVPMLVTQGSADAVNPPAASQQIFQDAQAPKVLEWLIGADHLGPYTLSGPAERAVAAVSTAFFDTYARGIPPAESGLLTVGEVPGVAQETADVDGS